MPTKKRYIKLLMSKGLSRNQAQYARKLFNKGMEQSLIEDLICAYQVQNAWKQYLKRPKCS